MAKDYKQYIAIVINEYYSNSESLISQAMAVEIIYILLLNELI